MAEPQEQTGLPGRKLTVHDLDVMIRRLDSLPTFPCVVSQVTRSITEAIEARSDQARADARRRAVDMVGSDPALTARLLALAGAESTSAVANVAQAVETLGLDALRAMVLSAEVFADDAPYGCAVNRLELWKHSLGVSLAAEMIARASSGGVDAGEARACGLLHDLGKLAMAHCMPKSYRRVLDAAGTGNGDVQAYERKIIGFEHSVVGRRLAEQWNLPAAICETAWLSNQPVEAIPKSISSPATVAAVALADAMACQLNVGSTVDHWQPGTCEQLAGRMGISPEALEDVRERLVGEVERRCDALGLNDPAGGPSRHDALARANTELGRLNRALRLRAEGLAEQAEAFGYLQRFAAALLPESTLGDVLERAAETIAAVLGCEPSAVSPVVAYAVAPGQSDALAARLTGTGESEWRTFDAPPLQREGVDRPAEMAAEAIAALAGDPADLTEWLDPAGHAPQGLVCAGQWIGGVFYPVGQGGSAATKGVVEAIGPTMALALAMVQARSASMLVGEQLAGASQVLAATREALAEAKTLSAVGEMAAGAAHELNTPLAVISGRAQLMRERGATEEEKKTWQLISDQAHCISDIITELMAFASPPPAKPTQFTVGELLKEVAEEFSSGERPQDGSSGVDILIAEDTPRVRADRGQIHEAVLELMTNAATAGGSRPRIKLEAEFDEVNDAVMLKVEDSGPGMDERTAGRAFTPFFSSQKAGRRRGMGLPRVKRIVENNGGRIWLKTRRGEGTTVCMLLPKA